LAETLDSNGTGKGLGAWGKLGAPRQQQEAHEEHLLGQRACRHERQSAVAVYCSHRRRVRPCGRQVRHRADAPDGRAPPPLRCTRAATGAAYGGASPAAQRPSKVLVGGPSFAFYVPPSSLRMLQDVWMRTDRRAPTPTPPRTLTNNHLALHHTPMRAHHNTSRGSAHMEARDRGKEQQGGWCVSLRSRDVRACSTLAPLAPHPCTSSQCTFTSIPSPGQQYPSTRHAEPRTARPQS